MNSVDERIALEFLGWTKHNTYYYDSTGQPKYEIPSYSSNDNLAFNLLKILRNKFRFSSININSDSIGNWNITVYSDRGYYFETYDAGAIVTLNNKEFAPLVCEVILHCMDWLKENKQI